MSSLASRRSVKTSTVDFVLTCCLHSRNVSSTFGASLFRDHFCVRFRYNLIPRTYPRDRFVGRLQRLDFSPHCYPSYRAPTLTLAGLSPAEHTSLCWTHIPAKTGVQKTSKFFHIQPNIYKSMDNQWELSFHVTHCSFNDMAGLTSVQK